MTISENWGKISAYIKSGTNLVPVRDRPDSKHPAKSPYFGWRKYQSEMITEGQLFQELDRLGTSATAFVCGVVSGNMEIIDIDSKHNPGIEVLLFAEIKQLMPTVWERLRIHITPSLGRHIIYKIADHAPGASRKIATLANAKEAFIESRGEGAIALSDCCLNYTVEFDRPIPTISWLERCSLFAIAESFNEKIKIEFIKPLRTQSDYYQPNADPFHDFNQRDRGVVLEENGWKVISENNKFVWFCRPEKSEGISASFNKEKQIYYIFTSSTGFDGSKGYFPSIVLSKLKFNNDHKACYKWLVESGYGKVDPIKELKSAKNKAKRGEEIPANFSTEAKALYTETVAKQQEAYPFGVFIKYNGEDKKLEVSRDALYNVAGQMGFRLHKTEVVRIEEYIINRKTERDFYDDLKAYIKADNPDELEELLNIWEKFIQKNGVFTMGRLPVLDTAEILRDDKQNAYQLYENVYLHITASGIAEMEYPIADGKLVFAEKIHDREFYHSEDGSIYQDYLQKAVGFTTYVQQILGFLCHDYKDETTAFLPILTEQCENPEDGGGTGKNVFCSLLKNVTTMVNKNCGVTKQDEKFFQLWSGQRLVVLSDLPENFDFGFLKEASSGSLLHKRLFKNETEVSVHDAPKIICQTNYSVEIKDGGIKRRVRMLEFTNYFTLKGGIDQEYGKHFPNDWNTQEWLGFDNVIARSLHVWLNSGLKISEPKITETGWLKQFKQSWGPTITELISCYFKKWHDKGRVCKDEFNENLQEFYKDNNTPKNFQPSSQRINKAIAEYCKHVEVAYVKQLQYSENGIHKTGKGFGFVVELEGSSEQDSGWEELKEVF